MFYKNENISKGKKYCENFVMDFVIFLRLFIIIYYLRLFIII